MNTLTSLIFWSSCIMLLCMTLDGRAARNVSPSSLSVSVSPMSATYSTGQSITVTVTGGTDGREYTLALYDGDPTDAGTQTSDLEYITNSDGNTNNMLTWATGQTSIWFVVRFKAPGSDRVLDVGNALYNEFVDTDLAGFTILPKPALNVSFFPESASYTVGQSVTLTLTGGIPGEKYVPLLFDGPASLTSSNDISQYLMNLGNSQGNGNTVTWQPGSTSEQFYLRFDGGAGTGRIIRVSNLDFTHSYDSGPLTIINSCDPLQPAHAYSVIQTAVLGPDNCSVQLTGTGFGTGYTITGPDGYVFSTVYRKTGSYSINGLNVKQPGQYTFNVSNQNACGEISTDTMTYVVTGTACK